MPLILPNQGLEAVATILLKAALVTPPVWVMTLYKNDLTPDSDTVLDDLDIADFGGFIETILSRSQWAFQSITDDFAVFNYGTTPQAWTCTANPQTVYGWGAYDPDTLQLVIVERFDTARPVAVGQTLKVQPVFKLGTWYPCP